MRERERERERGRRKQKLKAQFHNKVVDLHQGFLQGLSTMKLVTTPDAQPCSVCGRFSKVHVSLSLPDPGALNSCMHTFPENTIMDLLWLNTSH